MMLAISVRFEAKMAKRRVGRKVLVMRGRASERLGFLTAAGLWLWGMTREISWRRMHARREGKMATLTRMKIVWVMWIVWLRVEHARMMT